MTLVKRREPPFCQGCTGMNGWGACSTLRPRRHRHGDLPAEDSCSLWVCGACRRPSRMVYAKRLAEMCGETRSALSL